MFEAFCALVVPTGESSIGDLGLEMDEFSELGLYGKFTGRTHVTLIGRRDSLEKWLERYWKDGPKLEIVDN